MENYTLDKRTSYFNKFCIFCYWSYQPLLKLTGVLAVIVSLLTYLGIEFEPYDLTLNNIFTCLLAFFSSLTAFILIFAFLALRHVPARRATTSAEETEVKSTIIRVFCYKWCPRLLTILGICCVCLVPPCLVSVLVFLAGVPDEYESFLNICFFALQCMYYFCLIAAVPILFTAFLKLIDR